jgi:predicted kinase
VVTGEVTVPQGRLIVMCGLPGAGKTTTALHLAREVGAVRLCSDEWMTALEMDLFDEAARSRVDALQQHLACELLRLGSMVIYESGGWTRAERDALRDRARRVGALVELRFLDVPVDELWRRVSGRNARLGDSTRITRALLLEWSRSFEPPLTEEMRLYDPSE